MDVHAWLAAATELDIGVDLVEFILPALEPISIALAHFHNALADSVLAFHGLTQLVASHMLVDFHDLFGAAVQAGANQRLKAESQSTAQGHIAGQHDAATALFHQAGCFIQVVIIVLQASKVLNIALSQFAEASHRH